MIQPLDVCFIRVQSQYYCEFRWDESVNLNGLGFVKRNFYIFYIFYIKILSDHIFFTYVLWMTKNIAI